MIDIIFNHSEPVSASVRTFWFKPTQPFFYTAGQFTELHLPHHNVDDRGLKRYFTLSSSPTEPLLGITTRLTGDVGSSFKRRLEHLQPGDHVQAAEALGDFVLPKDTSIPVVFIAVGIGATPVRSIVHWLADTHSERHVSLIQAAGSPDGLLFQDIWRSYPLVYTPVVKRQAAGYTSEIGTLTVELILRITPPDTRNLYFLSGPEQLVEALTKDLVTAGVPGYRVITDYFHGYSSAV